MCAQASPGMTWPANVRPWVTQFLVTKSLQSELAPSSGNIAVCILDGIVQAHLAGRARPLDLQSQSGLQQGGLLLYPELSCTHTTGRQPLASFPPFCAGGGPSL